MDIKDFRRELHRKAELSFEEHATAAFIAERLSEAGIEFRPIASTGLLARIEGRRGNNKRCVVLRADIDALPIAELTGVGWGAALVLAEKPFDSYDVEAVIGEHVDADLEVGEIGFCPGKFMASADELYFTAKGVGGHAAMRSRIKDSVVAVADLIMRLNTLNSDVCVVSVGKVTADGATNVIPERTSCAGTMRTFNENLRARVKEMIAHMAEEIEYKYDVEVEADIRHGYPCVENDP